MTIGEKIIELRKKDNLTQEKLASKIGVSRQTLSSWESNLTAPNIKEALIIAEIFKIDLNDLVCKDTEVVCLKNKFILNSLKDKFVSLDIETDDYRMFSGTIYKVLDISQNFIKLEFKYKKKKITKLVDMKLISSITCIEGE